MSYPAEKEDFTNGTKTAPDQIDLNTKKPFERKKPKVPRKITERYLHNAGLAYLQRFSSSSANFRRVMLRKIDKSCRHHTDQDKDNCEAILDKIILKFQDLELLNDDVYLRGMVISLSRRGLSSRLIQQKLIQKGLPLDDISCALKLYEEEEFETNGQADLYAAIIYCRKKKFGPFDIMERKDPEKSLASMARAGYSYEIAQKVLKMPMQVIEEEFRFLL